MNLARQDLIANRPVKTIVVMLASVNIQPLAGSIVIGCRRRTPVSNREAGALQLLSACCQTTWISMPLVGTKWSEPEESNLGIFRSIGRKPT